MHGRGRRERRGKKRERGRKGQGETHIKIKMREGSTELQGELEIEGDKRETFRKKCKETEKVTKRDRREGEREA